MRTIKRRWIVPVVLLGALPTLGSAPAPATSTLDRPAAASAHRPPSHRVDLTAATPHRRAPASATRLAEPSTGDVTGDGLADAVIRDPGPDAGSLRLYTHDGSTTSNPWASYVSSGGAWDFADLLLLGDVTGDGRPDVVARDPAVDNGRLWIYPNNGSSTGNPWTDRTAAGTGWNRMDAILLGDVTGDGRPDLVVREPAVSSGTLWIYRHDGSVSGNPWTVARVWAGTGWNLADTMLMDDVNGDQERDIVVRDSAGSLWVYPHNGSHTGNPYTSRYSAGGGWGFANVLLLGDATDDGFPDVVARDPAGELWIYPHSGATSGNPYTSPRYSAGSGWGFANALISGDVTGDGRADLLARVHAGDLWLYPNDGSSPWLERVSAGTGWAFENRMLLGDVTGDGRPDLLARDPAVAAGALWVYPHTGSPGGDAWSGPRAWAGSGWNLATSMMLGDLTADGWSDILSRDRDGDLWIYPHNGSTTGNHWTAAPVWAGTGWNTARSLALGDVAGDDAPDLVDLENDGSLWIYVTGSSSGPIRVAGDWTRTKLLALGDVDGTGRLDLVTLDSDGALWIHVHDGSASGNPWSSSRSAGSGWSFASTLML